MKIARLTLLVLSLTAGMLCAEEKAGGAGNTLTKTLKVIFDSASDTDKAVADPYEGKGVALKAGRGHHQEQQLVLSGRVFFSIPADHTGQALVFRLGIEGPNSIRIVFSAKGKSISQTITAPDAGKWCDVELPMAVLGDGLGTGAEVEDITLFQKDPVGDGKLYLKSITLTAKSK